MCFAFFFVVKKNGFSSIVLLSFEGLEAVDAEELLLLVRETDEADSCLSRAAAPPWVGDGVAHTAVGQPACVASVIAQQLPRSEHLAHLGNLCTVIPAGLDRLII